MKNLIYLFLLTFSPTVFSQTFGELGDEWHNSYIYHIGPYGPGQGTSHHMEATMFKYVGDTSIALDTFQIIVRCQKRWGTGYLGFPAEYENDSIYVVQDSMQVFYGMPGNMKLIYDFNLLVGDSTLIHTGWNPVNSQYVHVIQTDSVQVGSTWRKRIIFDDINSWHQGMRWIEGVGDELYGVFRDPIGNYFDLHYSFLMKHENVIQIGTGSVQYTCSDDWMNLESIDDNNLNIFPNPVSDFATIIYSGSSSNYILEIYDARGNLVLEENVNSEKHSIDLRGLSNGLYVIQIKDSKSVHSSKIIKH